jgi:predicted PilT family ATPase
MSKVKPFVLKKISREIAKAISLGNTSYIHRSSAKVTTIDNAIEGTKLIAAQEQKLAEIEKKIELYIKVEPLDEEGQLVIMKEFLDEPMGKSVNKQLANALKRKKPVRNFNQAVNSDIELRQQWRNFNFEEAQRWVSNFIVDAYHYGK